MKNWIVPVAIIGVVAWVWFKDKKTQATPLPVIIPNTNTSGSGALPIVNLNAEFNRIHQLLETAQTKQQLFNIWQAGGIWSYGSNGQNYNYWIQLAQFYYNKYQSLPGPEAISPF